MRRNNIIFFIAITLFTVALFSFMNKATSDTGDKKTYSYLALGDSYTIGQNVPVEESFPFQVQKMLNDDGKSVADPKIIARTGWTTEDLSSAIKNTKLKKHYDFVTLLIGVNNQFQGKKVVDYIPDFEALVQKALRYTANDTSKVVIISIPDWGYTPFARGRDRDQVAKEIDEFNAANKLLAQKYHLHYIDITPASRKLADDPTMMASDGLHPSGMQYQQWAEQVSDYIRKKI